MVTGNGSEDDCRAMLERNGRSGTRADASNLCLPMYDLAKPISFRRIAMSRRSLHWLFASIVLLTFAAFVVDCRRSR